MCYNRLIKTRRDDMKIISFSAIKGGVGKTTLAFNLGEWLAAKGNKVLFIDLDHQCNLTQTYDIYDHQGTIANAFVPNQGDVTCHQVKPNISLLPGYMKLDDIEKELETKGNKDMLLYMWLHDNYDRYNLDQVDYVLVDCHPDFSTATRNAIAISHAIISPVIPSDYGYNAKFNLENRLEAFRKDVINYVTRESYITAKLHFVANMIKHNTNSSSQLLAALDDLVAVIPQKELFNRSTLDKQSLSEMRENQLIYQKHRKFFDELDQVFAGLQEQIDQD